MTSDSDKDRSNRAVGLWLAATALMVFAMMIIGAITRLTESGLSIVEWRPLIGALPPLSEAEWQRVFDLYRKTSEYALENAGMSLEAFKTIFWWEYIHRLWGRAIGLVFALPFFWFLLRRKIPSGYVKHGWILLFLGGLQGVIGWWMVKSGFVDRSDVSQYRLAIHLAMAFLILGYLVWLAIGLLTPAERTGQPVSKGLRRLGVACHAIIFFTVVSGALVAGSNAGFIYNDWPFMNGEIIPGDLFFMTPVWINFFENHATIQFDHRLLAYLTLATVIATWLVSRRHALSPRARLSMNLLLVASVTQAALGISTLMLVVPLTLAVLHQAGAAITFCLSIWVMRALKET
ncbi:MAG: COX15/CtaA family protein [Alphaproteobacteria bacterium]